MLPEIKDTITEFLGSNPGSCTRVVTEGTKLERSVVYEALSDLEYRGTVSRGHGLDGRTISFVWNLLD